MRNCEHTTAESPPPYLLLDNVHSQLQFEPLGRLLQHPSGHAKDAHEKTRRGSRALYGSHDLNQSHGRQSPIDRSRRNGARARANKGYQSMGMSFPVCLSDLVSSYCFGQPFFSCLSSFSRILEPQCIDGKSVSYFRCKTKGCNVGDLQGV